MFLIILLFNLLLKPHLNLLLLITLIPNEKSYFLNKILNVQNSNITSHD